MPHSINSHISTSSTLGSVSQWNDPIRHGGEEPFNESRMQSDLNRLLDYGNDDFKNSMLEKGRWFSGRLKKIVAGVKKNQSVISAEGLKKLRRDLDLWPKTDPNEFANRCNDKVVELSREIDDRLNDPLLGTSHIAQTNAQLVNLVRSIYGDQLFSLFYRTIPDLRSHEPVHPQTVNMLKNALVQPFIQNFKDSEVLVSSDPHTQFEGAQLSLVTEMLARLPSNLVDVMKNTDLQFVVSGNQVSNYARFVDQHQDLSYQMGLISYASGPQGNKNEVVVVLQKNSNDEWTLPVLDNVNTVNLFFNGIGQLLSGVYGPRLLNSEQTLSHSQDFMDAWQRDRQVPGQMGPEFSGSYYNDSDHDFAREYAFAEGFARTYFRGRTPAENSFAKWDNISRYFNEELIPKLDRVSRGVYID
jgi:hypothetical protein